tara:strand:- start:9897 stop:11006 length:1110 start_codon:yes stop_codon:yes gene_type:complete
MDFIDLKTNYDLLRNSIDSRIASVLESGQYILGEQIREMEQRLAHYVGVDHCVSVSSGTDALLIALMSLDIGIGDEVITSPFSFISSAEMIALLGAKPVFIDINEKTYNLNEDLLESAITKKTKAIIPVSLFGQCPNLDRINKIAFAHDVSVIEDGAQSFGSTYKKKKSCGITDIAATSFFPSKPLGCYGDGGALFTNNSDLVSKFKELRMHGESKRYHHNRIGINGRMDEIQASIILSKLEIFDKEIELRKEVAKRYSKLINIFFGNEINSVFIEKFNSSVFAQYTIQLPNRDEIHAKLKEKNIPTGIYYPVPLHHQPVFSFLSYKKGDFPVSEHVSKRVLSLPMHPYLKENDQRIIIEEINSIINNK